jgi:hypothetical protein
MERHVAGSLQLRPRKPHQFHFGFRKREKEQKIASRSPNGFLISKHLSVLALESEESELQQWLIHKVIHQCRMAMQRNSDVSLLVPAQRGPWSPARFQKD